MLGVMLGRLSPPIKNKIQAFPYKTWAQEFKSANLLGLDCIEWIYENSKEKYNPIISDDGIKKILDLSTKSNVKVQSLVADNYMEDMLFNANMDEIKKSISKLKFLINQCIKANIKVLELPLMGKTSIKNKTNQRELISNISDAIDFAQEKNIQLAFETDLSKYDLLDFILKIDKSNVGINYDMGNSAIFGYSQKDELSIIGKYVTNVHIKDGIKDRGTVPLGDGETDFKSVFSELKKNNYEGDFIFQSAREDLNKSKNKISPMVTMRKYINFFKSINK